MKSGGDDGGEPIRKAAFDFGREGSSGSELRPVDDGICAADEVTHGRLPGCSGVHRSSSEVVHLPRRRCDLAFGSTRLARNRTLSGNSITGATMRSMRFVVDDVPRSEVLRLFATREPLIEAHRARPTRTTRRGDARAENPGPCAVDFDRHLRPERFRIRSNRGDRWSCPREGELLLKSVTPSTMPRGG